MGAAERSKVRPVAAAEFLRIQRLMGFRGVRNIRRPLWRKLEWASGPWYSESGGMYSHFWRYLITVCRLRTARPFAEWSIRGVCTMRMNRCIHWPRRHMIRLAAAVVFGLVFAAASVITCSAQEYKTDAVDPEAAKLAGTARLAVRDAARYGT